jgi:hypothetical protein
MLVFIDDSGDPSFSFDKGSTPNFVISAVIFDDNLEAEKVSVALKEYKRSLGFPDDVEFKFAQSRDTVRTGFLQIINKFKFRVRYLVVDKKLIRSSELKNNKNSFYSYAIKMLLKHSKGTINDARIKIDGSGDRVFKKNFINYLRRELNVNFNNKILLNCKLVDSKGNMLIQMADMIAGAIRRSYDPSKVDGKIYKDIISRHIEDGWEFK